MVNFGAAWPPGDGTASGDGARELAAWKGDSRSVKCEEVTATSADLTAFALRFILTELDV